MEDALRSVDEGSRVGAAGNGRQRDLLVDCWK